MSLSLAHHSAGSSIISGNPLLARKKARGRCFTPHCRNAARTSRNYCCTCSDRRWREANPITYLLKNLRTHAKARGKEFSLTLEQFTAFCLRTEYHLHHGREANCLTIDRIDERRGYHADNIQVLTNSENAAKRFVPYFQQQTEREARIAHLRRYLT